MHQPSVLPFSYYYYDNLEVTTRLPLTTGNDHVEAKTSKLLVRDVTKCSTT